MGRFDDGKNTGGGGGRRGGMSRAAKKRAKKRQREAEREKAAASKKKEEEEEQVGGADDDDDDDDDGPVEKIRSQEKRTTTKKEKKKKKKRRANADGAGTEGDGTEEREEDVEGACDDDDGDYGAPPASKETKKRKENGKSKRGTKSEEHDSDKDEDAAEEAAVASLLLSLTPSQILFPPESSEDEEHDDGADADAADGDGKGEGGDMPHPSKLVRDVTAKARAAALLSSLLAPSGVGRDEFYAEYWERKPLLVGAAEPDGGDGDDRGDGKGSGTAKAGVHRLDGILTKSDIEEMVERHSLRYGRDLNVTRYVSSAGRRVTLDPPARPRPRPNKGRKGGAGEEQEELENVVADSKSLWSHFDSGCTIRLLCPHMHSDAIHALLSTLESEWGCMVGSNAYLTPGPTANSKISQGGGCQGFAPHYDDIEAFVLQLEGSKRWRVYPPPSGADVLARVSSRDYTEQELEEMGLRPVIDHVLKPGDLLYMPRGWVHQAHTVVLDGPGERHSLHLTVSAMQNWSWSDLLELVLPEALEVAASSESSASLREGLPRDFLSYMGTMHADVGEDGEGSLPEGLRQAYDAARERSGGDGGEGEGEDDNSERKEMEERRRKRRAAGLRAAFKEEAKKRILRVCREAASLIDDGCDQIGKRFLSDRQPPAFTSTEAALTNESSSAADGRPRILPDSMCRVARPGIARLCIEDGKAVLYHCADNTRTYRENPLSPMEFELDDAPALEMLLTTVEPRWVQVKDLIHEDIEDKMEIAKALYEEGILAVCQAGR